MTGERPYPFAPGFYRDQVFKDPKWDYTTQPVNFDTHVDIADAPENLPINATNPDLTRFVDRGGKLMLVGGWNDHTLGPGNNVHYYKEVVKKMGERKIPRLRAPVHGAGHGSLLRWRIRAERKVADDLPRRLRRHRRAQGVEGVRQGARHNRRDDHGQGQRAEEAPGLRLPEAGQYNGKGNMGDPENFSCKNP